MSTTTYVYKQNKETNVYPCKSQFYYIKLGFKRVKNIYACFCDDQPTKLHIKVTNTRSVYVKPELTRDYTACDQERPRICR